MKPEKTSAKAHAPSTPLDLQRFPMHAQADGTPSRDEVRDIAHPVTAPRQTKRRATRNKKPPKRT